jgi:tetratricopeptide (TPR) repeat protein
VTVRDKETGKRLEAAVGDHRAGRLQAAIAAYEDLLRRDPSDADIMQRLGVALAQVGRHEEGAFLLSGSLDVEPNRPSVILNLARALHALGREEDALGSCDRALILDANLAAGHRLRSIVLSALGRRDEALASSGQAVRLAPQDAASHVELGVGLAGVGRMQDALRCFERGVELDPNLVAAHLNLATLAAQLKFHERALKSLDAAIALQPQQADLYNNRGNALKELGRLPEALESYATALAIDPKNLETLHNRAVVRSLLGQYAEALRDYDELIARHDPPQAADLIGRGAALVALGRHEEALAPLDGAIAALPGDAEPHIQRGVALLRLNRHAEALANFDRALALRFDLPEVLNNRGVALAALGRPKEALDSFVRSLVLNGAAAETYINMGVVQKMLGQHSEADGSFRRALDRKPDDPTASLELAFLHLTLGEFKQGWPLYEARLRMPALAGESRGLEVPRWDGTASLKGKILLVHAEQGLGDTIQFCRYVPLLSAQGATVVFEIMPPIKALLRSLPIDVEVLERGEPLPPIDYHCPLLSLPLAFDTQLSTIPCSVPYLAAEPERVKRWAAPLNALKGLRIGIAWQGNPKVEQLIWARGRSLSLAALEPLANIPGVNLVSLQKGPGLEQLRACTFRDRILDLGPEFDPGPDAFLDAAAVMAGLDLVICSDTAVAHLAGALRRPVWVALNATPDWRWMVGRHDSPWYPTMRLFRQPRDNVSDDKSPWSPIMRLSRQPRARAWHEVVAAMQEALGKLVAQRAADG